MFESFAEIRKRQRWLWERVEALAQEAHRLRDYEARLTVIRTIPRAIKGFRYAAELDRRLGLPPFLKRVGVSDHREAWGSRRWQARLNRERHEALRMK